MSKEEVNSSLTIETFQTWISKEVEIRFTDADVRTACIVEVNELGKNKDKDQCSFSLTLQTSMKEQYYTQGTFRVVLPDEQETMMFMVPVGLNAEKTGMQYEVIYN